MIGTVSFTLPLHVLHKNYQDMILDAEDEPARQMLLIKQQVGFLFSGTILDRLVALAPAEFVSLHGGVINVGYLAKGLSRDRGGILFDVKAEIDPASAGQKDLQLAAAVILEEMSQRLGESERDSGTPGVDDAWFAQIPFSVDVLVPDPDRKLSTCSVRNDEWYLLCQHADSEGATKRIQIGASGDTYDDKDPTWGQVSRVLFSFLDGELKLDRARMFQTL